MTAARYSLEPLLRLTGWTMNHVTKLAPCNGTEYRLRRSEGVTERTADLLAVKAGMLPADVWPEYQLEGSIVCLECEQPFIPGRSDQVYCAKRCRARRLQREWSRRRYQTDPAFAEAKRRARREFYAECADYEKARERRRYHARQTDQENAA